MFWRPAPSGVAERSNPRPSSRIESTSSPWSSSRLTATSFACAYLAAFCRASSVQK
jgi:hypothetical protein